MKDIIYKYKRKIKFLYQRVFRGWDDSDTWNLDYKIAEFTLPRLKRFKELHNSYPVGLTEEEWIVIIDEMIYSFETTLNEDIDYDKVDWDKVERGYMLFGKYFRNLWW